MHWYVSLINQSNSRLTRLSIAQFTILEKSTEKNKPMTYLDYYLSLAKVNDAFF